MLGLAWPGLAVHAADLAGPAPPGPATVRVSVGWRGQVRDGHSSSPAVSANGRYVAFVSDSASLVPRDTNGVADVFVRDLKAARTTRVSVTSTGRQGNAPAGAPSISGDGR